MAKVIAPSTISTLTTNLGNADRLLRDQSAKPNYYITGTVATSSGSPTLSGFTTANIANIQVNESITGAGIPAGTRVLSVNTTALTVTMTANATASATVTVRISDRPRTAQFGFAIPDSCSSVSYTISALQEA